MHTLATCYHSSFIAFDTRYRRGKLSQISARFQPENYHSTFTLYNWDLIRVGGHFLDSIWGGNAKNRFLFLKKQDQASLPQDREWFGSK